MLDAGALGGDTAVASHLGFGDTLAGVASTLDMHAPAGLLQAGFAFNALSPTYSMKTQQSG